MSNRYVGWRNLLLYGFSHRVSLSLPFSCLCLPFSRLSCRFRTLYHCPVRHRSQSMNRNVNWRSLP